MAFSLKIKYYNSFWLKKVTSSTQKAEEADWPGLPWDPSGYPAYPYNGGDWLTTDTDTGRPYFFYLEEARIRGGFNNTSVDFGVRAYLKEEDTSADNRDASLIYSGIYNSRTGVNNTNQFPSGEEITRSLDPTQGSIQKLYAENTDLNIFQENKTSKALIDKDAIYTAEGTALTNSGKIVIGQVVPYLGEYGISKNPESFAVFGFRKYYTDRYRNKVLRLSRDGITEISEYGMRDYFRDQFQEISDDYRRILIPYEIAPGWNLPRPLSNPIPFVELEECDLIPGATLGFYVNGEFQILNTVDSNGVESPAEVAVFVDDFSGFPAIKLNNSISVGSYNALSNRDSDDIYIVIYQKDRILGAYDNYNDQYTLSIQNNPPNISQVRNTYDTLVYDEGPRGWVSFYTYKPQFMESLRGDFYSFYNGKLWKHNDQTVDRNNFYNTYNADQDYSSITLIFNPSPSITKNFNTVSYEGSNGWEALDEALSYSGISSPQEFDDLNSTYVSYNDTTQRIRSYDEGKYTDNGVTYRSGFDRKENRYVANIVNNSEQRIGEVVFGDQMSGVKGYYLTVTIRTDETTDSGGVKELFAVTSNYVISSY